ncbi:hypothetical protein SPI_09409 [Niveomyces insectorum RCEF 264]|uniref:Tim44-like domain-containing protein n=1 Tax=Niveomyces insectorum RCEF 264 TaxID=1081102 RepID=A0A167LTK9_9HYPO|nr:hypothetical protein SPI_09409 [Niveomyces insectorum RCEF 264]
MASLVRQPLRRAPAVAPLDLLFAPLRLRPQAFSSLCGPCARWQSSSPQYAQPLQPHRQRRYASSKPKPAPRRRPLEMSPTARMSQMNAYSPARLSIRLPQTFVNPTMSRYLGSPAVFAKLLWHRFKTHAADRYAEFSLRVQSKPGFFQAGRFRPNRAGIVAVAKSMHYDMLAATAAGDTRTLARLLTTSHYDDVAGLLARRPAHRRYGWELLAYQGRPQLVDCKVAVIPGPFALCMRQAVVRIRSRQRFTSERHDGADRTVVEKDVTENVVLLATLNRTTWETSEWRIFGFMPETTLPEWEAEKKLVEQASKENTGLQV